MLTRLKVKGFKNLVDVDLRFGPFTVIAGANGVGKSNLFDAIRFLSSLMDKTLLDAATRVRQETSSAMAARIFTQSGEEHPKVLRIEAEMLVGPRVLDDLDQEAIPSARHLRYIIELHYSLDPGSLVPRFEITHESLDYLNREESAAALPFAKNKKAWISSVLGGHRTKPLITTKTLKDDTYIKIHEDSGHQGRPRELKASALTRTVISTINSVENPTALAARREMQSWKLLQLEPSCLRAPSDWRDKAELGLDGSGLAATLYRLLQAGDPADMEARIVARLFDLIGDVRRLRIDPDEKRETFTVLVGFRDGTEFRARDLSDGTLRILALAVFEADPEWSGLVCMEEPENGIHPARVPAILSLLESIAVSLDYPVDEANPLRQVVLNTHSPEVVGLAPADSLLVAVPGWGSTAGPATRSAEFRPLESTWRDEVGRVYVTDSQILEYLKAVQIALDDANEDGVFSIPVAGRAEIRSLFPAGSL